MRLCGLEHAQLNETPCKHTQSANETHSHEHTQQDVIQHHGHKLPLLCSLQENREFTLNKARLNGTNNMVQYTLLDYYIVGFLI